MLLLPVNGAGKTYIALVLTKACNLCLVLCGCSWPSRLTCLFMCLLPHDIWHADGGGWYLWSTLLFNQVPCELVEDGLLAVTMQAWQPEGTGRCARASLTLHVRAACAPTTASFTT